MNATTDSKKGLPLSPGILLAILGAGFAGRVMGDSAPIAMGAFQDAANLTAGQAGTILSFTSLAGGIASLLIAPFMSRLSRPLVAYSGLALITLATIASLLTSDYVPLLIARTALGGGLGLMLAAANAAFGALQDPDRAAGLITVIASLLAALFVFIVPIMAAREGLTGLFLTQLVFIVGFGLFAFRLPNAPPQPPKTGRLKLRSGFISLQAFMLLASLALLMVGESIGWVLAERRGVALGLSPERIGLWFGVLNIFGMVGAGLVAWFSTRYGRFYPWLTGMVILALGILLVHSAPTAPPWGEAAFGLGMIFWAIGFFVQAPYAMGAISVLDPQGRLGALKGAAMVLGSSTGPTLGGLIIEYWGSAFIGPVSAVAIGVSILMAGAIIRRLDRAG